MNPKEHRKTENARCFGSFMNAVSLQKLKREEFILWVELRKVAPFVPESLLTKETH